MAAMVQVDCDRCDRWGEEEIETSGVARSITCTKCSGYRVITFDPA